MKLIKKFIITFVILIWVVVVGDIFLSTSQHNRRLKECESSLIFKSGDMVVLSGFEEKLRVSSSYCSNTFEPIVFVEDRFGNSKAIKQIRLELSK